MSNIHSFDLLDNLSLEGANLHQPLVFVQNVIVVLEMKNRVADDKVPNSKCQLGEIRGSWMHHFCMKWMPKP